MSSHSERTPADVPQIIELHMFKNISPAIHAFNSLVLDEKLRWYSEKPTKEYFLTEFEFNNYMQIIDDNPMDFGTIRKQIYNNHYKDSNQLFEDMKLVFHNAIIFNKKGNIWHNEAKRLNKILLCLENIQSIRNVQFIPYDNTKCGFCPECNNIFSATENIEYFQCKQCKQNSNNCFICYNHSQSYLFCDLCINNGTRRSNRILKQSNINTKRKTKEEFTFNDSDTQSFDETVYECIHCGYGFDTQNILDLHIENNHKKNNNNMNDNNEEKNYDMIDNMVTKLINMGFDKGLSEWIIRENPNENDVNTLISLILQNKEYYETNKNDIIKKLKPKKKTVKKKNKKRKRKKTIESSDSLENKENINVNNNNNKPIKTSKRHRKRKRNDDNNNHKIFEIQNENINNKKRKRNDETNNNIHKIFGIQNEQTNVDQISDAYGIDAYYEQNNDNINGKQSEMPKLEYGSNEPMNDNSNNRQPLKKRKLNNNNNNNNVIYKWTKDNIFDSNDIMKWFESIGMNKYNTIEIKQNFQQFEMNGEALKLLEQNSKHQMQHLKNFGISCYVDQQKILNEIRKL